MQNRDNSDNPEDRLARLEKVLNFDNRIKAIEEGYGTKKSMQPWWQSAAIVTLLTAIIALIIPTVTAIEAHYKNKGETERLLIAQGHSIRQTYLDRVLKPGLNEIERYNIFRLLARLKEDSVIYGWAQENLAETTKKLFDARRESAIKLMAMAKQLDSLKVGANLAVGSERQARLLAIRDIQFMYSNLQKQQRDIKTIIKGNFCIILNDVSSNKNLFDGNTEINISRKMNNKINAAMGFAGVVPVNGIFPVNNNNTFCTELTIGFYNISIMRADYEIIRFPIEITGAEPKISNIDMYRLETYKSNIREQPKSR